MQMWYNDSMISSSKRREKGYRFDSHEHAASFVYNPAATTIRERTLTHKPTIWSAAKDTTIATYNSRLISGSFFVIYRRDKKIS